jgi:tryptophan-rich sensory protein
MIKILYIILFILPLVSGYSASYLYPTDKNVGSSNPVTPPPWVFGVVWSILYILIGISWILMRKKKVDKKSRTFIIDSLFITLVILLFMWIYVANRLKKYTYAYYLIVIISTIAFILATIAHSLHEPYILLWTPFIAWITIASKLNYSIAYNA